MFVNRGLWMLTIAAWALSLSFASAAPPAGYYLVWGDEFNATSLDTTKWDYWLPGKWRDAVNVNNAVTLNGSNLVITTYTANGTNYTAMLASEHHFRPRYGYYEASIKWGDTNGMWSAFWLRSPTMGTWLDDWFVSGAEMDVAEHRYVGIYGTNIANIVSENIHWNGYGSAEQSSGSPNVGTGLATGFHTYSLLWSLSNYSFGIDGTQAWNGASTTPPFGSGVYVLLSSEVDDTSTTWAGYIPPGGYPGQANSTVQMIVDYFRYYAPTNVLFWTGAGSAYWTNSANWVSNLPPVSSSDLTFSYLSRNLSNFLGSDYTVDGLVFLGMTNGPASINGTNTLTLGPGGVDMVAADQNVILNAPLNLSANQRWTVGRNNPGNLLSVNSSLSGTATLTKAGYGTLLLNGTNSFSGILNADSGGSTNDGVLIVARSAAIANVASPVMLRNTGRGVSTLLLSNNVTIAQNLTMAGRNTNVAALRATASAANTLAGGLTLTAGGSNYLVQCDAGTLNLGGTISAGATATGPVLLTLQGNGSFSISGPIQNGSSSALSLFKNNGGSLTLSGVNTFTGTTLSARGNVFLNGSLAGPLVVNGGYLAGNGTVAGDANIQGGNVAPGSATVNAIGTLSFGGNLTLGPASTTWMEIDAAMQTNDLLNVTSTLTYGGTLFVSNLEGTLAPGQTFKLFNAASFAGSFFSLLLPSLSAGLAWNTNGLTNGVLSVVAIPETLSITNVGSGQWQLNWLYGTLQGASNVSGPYNDLSNAFAPYSIPLTNPQQFYRVREW